MKLDGSIAAVVTGGASGLGEGTARAIAATGAKVALFDMNTEKGEAIAAEIGGVFCQVDVTDDASVTAAFDKARAVPSPRPEAPPVTTAAIDPSSFMASVPIWD